MKNKKKYIDKSGFPIRTERGQKLLDVLESGRIDETEFYKRIKLCQKKN